MNSGFISKVAVEVNDVEYEVECRVSDYYPAVMYLRNGDPGYPEEGGEIEEITIYQNGNDITEHAKESFFVYDSKKTLVSLHDFIFDLVAGMPEAYEDPSPCGLKGEEGEDE